MTFLPELPIVTERLTLRSFERGDHEPLADLYTRADVVRFLYTDVWTERQAEAQLLLKMSGARLLHEGDVLTLAVVPRGGDRLVGEVLIKWRSARRKIGELGYVLHPDVHGLGYATEAGRAMLRLAFDAIGLQVVQARCDARNAASVAVMTRLGMRRQTQLGGPEQVKGAWVETLVFSVDAASWGRLGTHPNT